MKGLDKNDCVILNVLQKDCRTSLTDIANRVCLSIDSVKKRIKKMRKNKIFHPQIQIRPRNFGFNEIIDIKIKLNNHSKEDRDKFISYLQGNPRIAEIFSVSGEWDLSIVLLSKNAADLEKITSEIKSKFGKIINSWSESMTLKSYKFETYDMRKLLGFDD